MNSPRARPWHILIPTFGIVIFIILYVVATFYYPGGTFNDKSSKGFSWLHNYWCELMSPQSKNGEINHARPIALAAMIMLVTSLSLFWVIAWQFYRSKDLLRHIMLIGGIGSMFTVIFLSGNLHDIILNISGVLGCTAIIILLNFQYREKATALFYIGIFCMLLIFVNNYIYYSGNYFDALAVIQKITFIAFLAWFALSNLGLYYKASNIKN